MLMSGEVGLVSPAASADKEEVRGGELSSHHQL